MCVFEIDSSNLTVMSQLETAEACELIAISMNMDEARWAEKTMNYQFGCLEQGIDDGRRYFTYRGDGGIQALVGLHHYEWGPEENVWLSWFAVHPDFQRKGIGTALIKLVELEAKTIGYTKLFVETYANRDFDNAINFYEACDFERVGTISNYLPDTSDMVVYGKNLN